MTNLNEIKKTNHIQQFEAKNQSRISKYKEDQEWQEISAKWMKRAFEQMYMYNFKSLGRPVIQTPIDIVAVQELIWEVKPDLIIETGIAHGGSLILSASILAMLDYADAVENGTVLDPKNPKRKVIGIDIDIRDHNRQAMMDHPLIGMIDMIEGSSIDQSTIDQVKDAAKGYKKILVFLDSMHTHDHVLSELEAYAPMTSKGSYCVVFDTIVEDLPKDFFEDRPWNPGNNPKTALHEYLKNLKNTPNLAIDGDNLNFEIDHNFEDKLLMTVAPDGFLKRV